MAITKKRVPGQSCLQTLNRARATFPVTALIHMNMLGARTN